MDELNKYYNEWKSCVDRICDKLRNDEPQLDGNDPEIDELMNDVTASYAKYKEVANQQDKMNDTNFGVINDVLESKMPYFLLKNRKRLGECLAVIKKDKNLLEMARAYNEISKYDGSIKPEVFITELANLTRSKIDKKTLKESKKKLIKAMKKLGVNKFECLDENKESFINAFEYLLENEKTIYNISESVSALETSSKYLSENVNTNSEKNTIYEDCDEFNNKLSNLNESERDLVNGIISAKSGVEKKRQERLFEKYKNECIKYVDSLINEANGEQDKIDSLNEIKNQLVNKTFNQDTIVEDIAKFLRIGSILSV